MEGGGGGDGGGDGGWAPRSTPLAAQLTDTLSALLDDQLQKWEMDNSEMDNQLQQQEAVVAKLVQDVEGALGEEDRVRKTFVQRLGEAEQYVAARRVGPARIDELYEELEHIAARVDNDFDSLGHSHVSKSEEVFLHFTEAGEKCGEVRKNLMHHCRRRFRRMGVSPEMLFQELDANHDGTIDEDEFLEAVRGFDSSTLERMFYELDRDGSGRLSAKEVRELEKGLGLSLSEAEAQEAMAEMDPSGDGEVDLLEFTTWWRHHAGQAGGKGMGGAVAAYATAQEQDQRWFFSEIESDHQGLKDGKISLRELAKFVWAWEPHAEFRKGEFIIAYPVQEDGRESDEPAVYTCAAKVGTTGSAEPEWVPGAGGTEEDGVHTAIEDGGVIWEKHSSGELEGSHAELASHLRRGSGTPR
jgi:hypothetical protein